jgi:ATPase family associated with various cellular activities (AAA)
MNTSAKVEDWTAANQRCLTAELAGLSRLLRGESADDAALNEARGVIPAPCALDMLCAMFRLSEFERHIVLLCTGMELQGDFADRCAAAPGSGANPWPSFGLALASFPEAHWDALANGAPLRRWRLIEICGNGALVVSRLRIDERILFFLTGVRHLDERLVSLVEPVWETGEIPVSQVATLDRLELAWKSAFESKSTLPVLQLCGADVSGKRAIAAKLAQRLTINLFRLDATSLPTNVVELETLHRVWEREAILQNVALLLEVDRYEQTETLRELAIDRWIDLTHTPLLVAAREPRRQIERPVFTVEVSKPTSEEQRQAWQQALGTTGDSLNGQLERVISQFDFSAGAIRTAAGQLGGADLPAGEFEATLWDVCRLHARPRLEDLAQRIHSTATWASIVLPAPQMRTLQTIGMHAKHRAKVLDRWGFAEQSNRGLGLSALFTGPSGTGKTLAAEILANELRLDLFRIDLSAVVSKYIGETEKNLRRVFDAAEEGGAVLLFDEADALFGKRSEVKDSHDRYANVEISYLLQRMEAYRGLAILTTNMKEALDPAFLRRLRFVVQFPFPDQAQRAEIWRKIFPAKTPTDSLDIGRLSRLSISGGNIRSIALNAAFAAADANEPVRMPHLLRAARLEYEKLEKPLTEAELGGWR